MGEFNFRIKMEHLQMTKDQYEELLALCNANARCVEPDEKSPSEWIEEMGYPIESETDSTITFMFRGSPVKYFKNKRWCSGRTVIDGRGLNWLLTQLDWWENKLVNHNK